MVVRRQQRIEDSRERLARHQQVLERIARQCEELERQLDDLEDRLPEPPAGPEPTYRPPRKPR